MLIYFKFLYTKNKKNQKIKYYMKLRGSKTKSTIQL